MYENGEDLNRILEEPNTPQPKFTEETSENIEDLITQINKNIRYKDEIIALDRLTKFKCNQSIKALIALMESNADFDLRKLAFNRLTRFRCDVRHPSKKEKRMRDCHPNKY